MVGLILAVVLVFVGIIWKIIYNNSDPSRHSSSIHDIYDIDSSKPLKGAKNDKGQNYDQDGTDIDENDQKDIIDIELVRRRTRSISSN